MVQLKTLETELVNWLGRCQPSEAMERPARELVRRGLAARRTAPAELTDSRAINGFEARLKRTRNLYKWGDISESEFRRDKAAIEADLAAIKATPTVPTVRQSSRRLMDLVAAWQDATPAERSKIASSILAVIEVKDGKIESFRPRPGWLPYFEEIAVLICERETGLEPATTCLEGRYSTS